jgi:hypothetical protein
VTLVGGLGCLALALSASAAAPGGSDAAPKLKSPPQAVVEQAIRAPLFHYGRTLKGGAHTNGGFGGGSLVTLAVASYAGNNAADARLLEQLRFMLQGDHCVSANGGYPAQHERHFTAACTLAKLTPRVWDQLTPAERAKIDLLMKATLVASAFTTSDAFYATGRKPVALDGDGNLNRTWNPNFQEGMVGAMIVGAAYFGPAEAQKILDTYEHAPFVKALRDAGLSNTAETFNWKLDHPESAAPTAAEIEQCVRGYRWMDLDLSDPMALYVRQTRNTYSAVVHAGLNDGAGVNGAGKIASGGDQLPNVGKPGMLKEFDSKDALGPRSSIHYAYDGFRPNLTNQIVLIASGLWKPGPQADECLALLNVGIPDLFYKLQHGYIDYAKGKAADKPFDQSARGFDFALTRSLWEDVVKPSHK